MSIMMTCTRILILAVFIKLPITNDLLIRGLFH